MLDDTTIRHAIYCYFHSAKMRDEIIFRYGPIEWWDVSGVKNMGRLFCDYEHFNYDITAWDVSSVKNMGFMFFNVKSFNQDISRWNISNVANMKGMFLGADSFNQDLNSWGIKNLDILFKDKKRFEKISSRALHPII